MEIELHNLSEEAEVAAAGIAEGPVVVKETKKEASAEDTEVAEGLMEAPEAGSGDETMQEASPKEESEALAAHL